MDLPVAPPVLPMLAKAVRGLPSDVPGASPEGGTVLEPEWDARRHVGVTPR